MKLNLRRIVLVLLIGVVMYGAFVGYAGYQTIADSLAEFEAWTFGAALGLASLNYVLRFAKWEYYLRVLGIEAVGKVDSLLIFLSGFVLTITPGKVGEVFKSALLSRTHGVAAERTSPIVIAERLTDVIAIVMLIVVGSTSLEGGLTWAALGAAAVTVGFVFIFWRQPAHWLLERMSSGWLGKVAPRLRTAYDNLQVLASPSALLVPVALSVVGWGCEGIALHLLLQGFGQEPGLAQAAFFYATATLAGALIPVPGGLGVTETLMQEQLIRLGGVMQGPATASMLLVRFATLWWAVIVGFIALGLLKSRYPGLLAKRPSGTARAV
jgi:uncharacterized protein (TIRG00374 family)